MKSPSILAIRAMKRHTHTHKREHEAPAKWKHVAERGVQYQGHSRGLLVIQTNSEKKSLECYDLHAAAADKLGFLGICRSICNANRTRGLENMSILGKSPEK